MNKMNKVMIATLASLFSLVMVHPAAAQVAPEVNMPDWQSMSPKDMLWVGKNLTGNDPAVTAARHSIADQVTTRFLVDPVATRTLSLSRWGEFATFLSADLTAEQRGQWIGKIRAAYVQDATGLASLKTSDDLGRLIGILSKLGDPQAGNVAGTFTLSTTAWQSWIPALSQRLSTLGIAGAEARLAVAGTVTSKYLSPESAKSLNLTQWNDLVKFLASGLSAEAKVQWAANIAQAYAGTGETAVSLSAKDTEQVTSILDQLGAKGMALDLVVRLAQDANVGKSMSLKELLWTVKSLTGNTPVISAARQSIADQLARRFLADPVVTRTLSVGQWGEFVKLLSADLTADQRGQWAAQIRAAYTQDVASLASLKTGAEVNGLIESLGRLGDRQADNVVAIFAQGTTTWQSWPPGYVVDLATRIAKLGESGAAARQSLIAFATSKYASAQTAKSLNPGQWQTLTGSLAPGLSKEAKAQWATAITQAFTGNSEAAGAIAPRDIQQLVAALDNLGAKAQAVDAMANLAAASTGWQKWDLDSQIWLIGVLTAPDKRESTKPARLRILEHITATCMPTAEQAKKVPLHQWGSLVMGLYDVMPEETSTLWAERLKGIFSGETLAAMGADAKQRRALLPIVAILDAKMKTGLALSWLKDKALWQGAPTEALAALAVAAYRDSRQETLPILGELDKFCIARHAMKPLNLTECLALRGMHLTAGDLPKAQQWVLVACDVTIGTEALRAVADQSTIFKLSPALLDTGLSGPSKDCSKLAATIAALVAKGKLDLPRVGQSKCIGEALGSAGGRQILREALLDAQGNPRLEAAKILACSYRKYGDFKAWRDYVGQQVSGVSDGDRKALWLMVKGYTDAVVPDSPNLLRIEAGATAALSQASTDAVRILALRELADVYERTDRPGVVVKILESIKGQFAGESLATVEAMQKDLRKKDEARAGQAQRAKVAAEAARKKALLAYYRKCLTQATARGDSTEAAKLQAAIGKLSE